MYPLINLDLHRATHLDHVGFFCFYFILFFGPCCFCLFPFSPLPPPNPVFIESHFDFMSLIYTEGHYKEKFNKSGPVVFTVQCCWRSLFFVVLNISCLDDPMEEIPVWPLLYYLQSPFCFYFLVILNNYFFFSLSWCRKLRAKFMTPVLWVHRSLH